MKMRRLNFEHPWYKKYSMSKEFFALGFFFPTTKHAKYDFVPMRHKSKFLKSSDFLISSPFSLEVFFIII